MRIPRAAAPAVLLATLALSLTACGPGDDDTPEDTPTPTVTSTLTPSPDATIPEDPETAAPTCESIVSPATIAGFTTDGIQITPPAEFAAKLEAEGNADRAFFDAGGVLCQTGQGAGAYEIYGFAVLSQAQFGPVQDQFLADGYIETFGDVGIQYEVPGDMEGLPRICYFKPDAFTVCGNDGDRLNEITDTLGL